MTNGSLPQIATVGMQEEAWGFLPRTPEAASFLNQLLPLRRIQLAVLPSGDGAAQCPAKQVLAARSWY